MPLKFDLIPIKNPFLDKRTKLLPCQKEMVLYWHGQGLSQRKLAKMFNVSRRLIQFVTDPSKHLRNIERRQERGGSSQYYNREDHNEAMQDHRNHKRELYKKGLIK